jgi:anhydro-N-acetylmuramic acid kinase
MQEYRAIGLMSGSSLDGLDVAYCVFTEENNHWTYRIEAAQTFSYSTAWVEILRTLPKSDAKTLCEINSALGRYFGALTNEFIALYSLQNKIDFIGSHGHTVFHFPSRNFTTQIGDGFALAAKTNLPVICDFRTADIAYGGQGTPIVPIGDLLLFPHFKLCLNIGGICNISCKLASPEHDGDEFSKKIIAFDVCAANQVLNFLANQVGKEFDENGELASHGNIHELLLNELNAIAYSVAPYPKSLDNSFSRDVIIPLISTYNVSVHDKLRTVTEHIAFQISQHIEMIAATEKIYFSAEDALLITGGGAFNSFLVERIRANTSVICTVPEQHVVKYKEALVMALMAALRMRNETNVLKHVTGATKNTVGGIVCLP